MRLKILTPNLLIILWLVLLLSNCSGLLGMLIQSNSNQPLLLDLSNPNHVLKHIQEPQIILPRSLQSGSTGTFQQGGTGSESTTQRSALGTSANRASSWDSTQNILEYLPYSKSANYLYSVQRIAYGSVGQTFLRALREIGSTTTIPLNEILYLDRVDLKIQGMDFYIEQGNTLVSRVSPQGNRLEFYWYGVIANQTYSHIENNTVPGYIYLSVNRAGHIIFQVDLPTWIVQTEPTVVRTPLRFTEVYDPNTGTLHIMNRYASHQDYTKIFKEGKAYIIMDVWGGRNISLTYGDDTFGGMIAAVMDDPLIEESNTEASNTEASNLDEPDSIQTLRRIRPALADYDALYLDYYDGNGNLVAQAWGRSTEITNSNDTNPYSWLDDQLQERGSLNIADPEPAYAHIFATNPKPEYILIKSTNYFSESIQPLPRISLDNGATWQEIDIYLLQVGNFHYKSGATWQPGDLAYFQDYSHYETSPDNSSITDYFGFPISYRIPQDQGEQQYSYDLQYAIPLYALFPLKPDYQHLLLSRNNPQTYVSWKSTQGQWHYGPQSEMYAMAPGPNDHHPDYPPQEYEKYTYWLENTLHNTQDNLAPADWNYNNPAELDPQHGDKNLGSSHITLYYWHQGNERLVQVPSINIPTLDLPPHYQYPHNQSIHHTTQTFNRLYTQFTTQVLPSQTMQIGETFPPPEHFHQ